MTGTPARPGITMVGPVSEAIAAPTAPIQTDNPIAQRRMGYSRKRDTVIQAAPRKVKAARPSLGKANALAWFSKQLQGIAVMSEIRRLITLSLRYFGVLGDAIKFLAKSTPHA